jgi:hypothetical protein
MKSKIRSKVRHKLKYIHCKGDLGDAKIEVTSIVGLGLDKGYDNERDEFCAFKAYVNSCRTVEYCVDNTSIYCAAYWLQDLHGT